MRTVSQNYLDNFGKVREVGARATIRDVRLRFSLFTDTNTVDRFSTTGNPKLYDADDYNGGVLRIVVMDESGTETLHWNYVSSSAFGTGTWPAWTSHIVIETGSRPAVLGNRVYYKKASDNNWYYAEYNGSILTGETLLGLTAVDAIAPVTSNIIYLYERQTATTVYAFKVSQYNISLTTSVDWAGYAYNTLSQAYRFDAIRSDGVDYVYFSDYEENRAVYLKWETTAVSNVRQFVPIDLVDDNSRFTLYGVTEIDNRVMVIGAFAREQSSEGAETSYMIYSWGPELSTLGRDMFICYDAAIAKTIGSYNYEPVGGKLHLIGDTLYYIGFLITYSAPATILVGYDAAGKKLTTSDIGNLNLSDGENQPMLLSFDLNTSVYDPDIIRPGAEVTLEVSLGGEYATVGVFGIDSVPNEKTIDGEVFSVVARSIAMKRMQHWTSDALYDYWSQEKFATNPKELSRVLRHEGDVYAHSFENVFGFPAHEQLSVDCYNEDVVLQATAKASRGGFVAARFFRWNSALYNPRRGVFINFSRDLIEGEDGIEDDDFENTGIALVYGDTEHSGSSGFALWHVLDGTWTKLTSWAYTIYYGSSPASPWHWIGLMFRDGECTPFFNEGFYDDGTAANPDWIKVGTAYQFDEDVLPWKSDFAGRAGIFMRDETTYSTSPAFNQQTMLIPVDDLTVFAATGSVQAEHERIVYTGKTPSVASPPQGMAWTTGALQPGAPHANAGFPTPDDGNGYAIYFDTVDSGAPSRSTYNDMVLVIEEGQGKGNVYTVTDYDYTAPEEWVDTGGPYTYPDKWQDHIGDLAYGNWSGASKRRVFVLEDPAGAFGADSVAGIYPALEASIRGDNAGSAVFPLWTDARYHDAGIVSQFTGVWGTVDRMIFSSDGQDYTISDMIGEIARKAGVLDVTHGMFYDGALSYTQAGWDVTNMDTALRNRKTFLARLTVSSGSLGMGYGFTGSPYNLGRMVVIDVPNTEVRWYDYSSGDLLKAFPIDDVLDEFTISVYNNEYVSVWAGGKLVAVFHDDNPPSGKISGPMSNGNSSGNLSWQDADWRVDNYILDMGFGGLDLVGQLIGDKRIYYREGQDGSLEVYVTRDTVNSVDEPYDLAVMAGFTPTDLEVLTRIRVEGAEHWEEADYTRLSDTGNIFALVNMRDLDTVDESREEAVYQLAEAIERSNRFNLQGAADIRIQAGDIIWALTPSGSAPDDPVVASYIVEGVQFTMKVEAGEAVFDMSISARRYSDPEPQLGGTQAAYAKGV